MNRNIINLNLICRIVTFIVFANRSFTDAYYLLHFTTFPWSVSVALQVAQGVVGKYSISVIFAGALLRR